MSAEFTEEWLKSYEARTGLKAHRQASPSSAPVEEAAPKQSKYHNVKTACDGVIYDSKHEAKVYNELRMQGLAGEFKGLARQVPFYLPGGAKYVADFVTLNNDGTYTVMDAKSDGTRKDKTYRLKRRQMKECVGIDIREV